MMPALKWTSLFVNSRIQKERTLVVHVCSLISLVRGNRVKVCGCIMGRAELIGQFSLDGEPRKYCISGGYNEGRWDGRMRGLRHLQWRWTAQGLVGTSCYTLKPASLYLILILSDFWSVLIMYLPLMCTVPTSENLVSKAFYYYILLLFVLKHWMASWLTPSEWSA